MRHGKKFNHLGRKTGHRKAMLANMACSLIEQKRINTTLAKAKALRQYVEPLITKSKDDSTHSRRVVFSYLKNKEAVTELFRDVAPKIAERPGGYTRILKTGNRLGDNAEMCFIELVDFNETYVGDKKDKKTTRRSRRGASGAGTKAKADAPADTVVAEEVKAEKAPEAKAEEVVAEAPAAEAVVAEEVAETTEAPAEEAKVEAKAEETPEASAEPAEAKEEKKEEGENPEENKEEDKKG